MKKNYDIAAIGECLMDCVPMPEHGSNAFAANAGGAPANLLAMLRRLM